MPNNYIRTKGAAPGSQAGAGKAVIRPTPIFGVVKDNIDPIRAGRLRVYISDRGGKNPNDSKSWVWVSYMSPFFGHTTGSPPNTGWGGYVENSASYGMWTSPPDIGTTVICVFVNGDLNYGYWIGCVPQAEKLYMVPAIGAAQTVVLNPGEAASYGGAIRLPVTNINTNNNKINNATKFFDQPKPVNSYAAAVYAQQGLIRDPIRGPIGSSAQRETPSRVGFGVSTPGRPIYAGGYTDQTITKNLNDANATKTQVISRRAGHSFVMDDGDITGRDQLIRLRTSLGHQILMSDDGQTLFIIHANGQSYIELGKEGTIDMYSTNSVNIRTQGDLNLHADNDININAANNLNIKGKNIKLESDEATTQRVGTDYSMHTIGEYGVKVNGQIALSSLVTSSLSSLGATFVNGIAVFLNTGKSPASPKDVVPITPKSHTDTLNDAATGWHSAPRTLPSIVSRAPAHAPWSDANLGVPVQVNNNAAAVLPSAPPEPLARTNASVPAQPPYPITPALSSTVPPTNSTSTLNSETVGTLTAAAASGAAHGPAAGAVATNMGTYDTLQGKQVSVGSLAQSPKQLEIAGVIKPGSAALIDALVAKGYSLEQAMTPNLFTGKVGADSLGAYANNLAAQVDTQVKGFTIAENQLINAGLFTSKTSGTQTAGPIFAATFGGVNQTLGLVRQNLAGAATAVATGSAAVSTGIAEGIAGAQKAITAPVAAVVEGATKTISTAATEVTTRVAASVKGLFGQSSTDAASSIAGNPLSGVSIGDSLVGKVDLSSIGTKGVASLTDAGTKVVDSISGAATDAGKSINTAMGNITDLFSAGNASAMITDAATGLVTSFIAKGIGKITAALDFAGKQITAALTALRGAAASAYDSIVRALPKLEAGVPQDLEKANAEAIAKLNDSGSQYLTKVGNSLVDAATDALRRTDLARKIQAGIAVIDGAAAKIGGAVAAIDNFTKKGSISANIGLPKSAEQALNTVTTKVGPPKVATNTDVGEPLRAAQVKEQLGDDRIPPMNYQGLTPAELALRESASTGVFSDAAYEKRMALREKQVEITAEIKKLNDESNDPNSSLSTKRDNAKKVGELVAQLDAISAKLSYNA